MNKSQKDFIELFDMLCAKQLPFVLFRLPQTQEIILYQQKDEIQHKTHNLNINGFVFAPFKAQNTNLYIPNTHSKHFLIPELNKAPEQSQKIIHEDNKAYYFELVNEAKKNIKANNLNKVVVSRKHKHNFSGSLGKSFLKLVHTYPNAMVYYWSHSNTGDWMGATPETLLRVEKGVCNTMALAGTLPFIENESPKWTSKELEEQQMVTDFIEAKLRSVFGKSSIKKSPVYSKRAGNLVHLCAHFEVPLLKNNVHDVVRLLHPTPAVAGVPVEKSLAFLSSNETHDRSYYAGFLGPVESSEVKLYVNIRCARVEPNHLELYVGGGITAESNAASEWDESQRKAETLLNIL